MTLAEAFAHNAVERPTAIAQLDAGPVEYRLERRAGSAIVVFHGGHMRAGLSLGEAVFADSGYTMLVPSRPGYGRTPLSVGRSPTTFVEVTRDLCSHLEIEQVAAVVGISAGGRTAIAMSARYPEFVQRLVLMSAVSYLPWPSSPTKVASWIAFNAVTGRLTWAVMATLMRFAPVIGLRAILRPLSTEPTGTVLTALAPADRAVLVALFSRLRSGRGFLNDLRWTPNMTREVTQPTLVVASRKDGSVALAHSESLAAGISRAKLLISDADSHFIWFGSDYWMIAEQVRRFLGREGM